MEVLATPKAIEAVSYDEKFLANVTRLIEEHISDSELNVNTLCDWAATNNKQMYRKLKQLTGMTPVEYIKSIRMKKAAMLLQQKKFTVAEVMYMVGFSNHSYFLNVFRQSSDFPLNNTRQNNAAFTRTNPHQNISGEGLSFFILLCPISAFGENDVALNLPVKGKT